MSLAPEQIWDDFLQRWPLEALPSLTLPQYSTAGDSDSFTYWLEAKTENLGSIWGGSAFKFGIFSRKDKTVKESGGGSSYSDLYAWYSKYGDTPEAAFERVKSIILAVATAARCGDFAVVEQADLGSATKWKLAFLYQNRAAPTILPIYRASWLRMLSGIDKSTELAAAHKALMTKRGDTALMTFSKQLWEQAAQMEQAWSTERMRALLDDIGDIKPVKPATKKKAGYELPDGRQLAINRESITPSLFLEPGQWQDLIGQTLGKLEFYPAERTRHSGLQANAPRLCTGHPAVLVTVESEEHFKVLLDAYLAEENALLVTGARDDNEKSMPIPLNQILYGPPGTGKTYETIYAALQILDPVAAVAYKQVDDDKTASSTQRLAAREKLKQRFDALSAEQRVRFVTFHQSFCYEDFVEGLRAETDETTGQIRYEVVDGVFKSLCESASVKVTQQAPAPVDLTGRRVWKMSLGNTQGSDAGIFDECLQGGYVLLGYGSSIDFSGCKSRDDVLQRYDSAGQAIAENTDYNLTSVTTFVTRMQIGDLVVVSDGNFKFRAIGEITGDYAYKPHPDYDDSYAQMRAVRWLRQYTPSLPRTELLNSQFSQMTLYELRSPALDKKKLAALLGASSSLHAASQFYVGQVFGRDYRVVRVTDDLLEISKPNGNLLPLSMSFLQELAEAVQAGKITIEDIRQKSAMNKLTNSQLEPFLVNGYPNILAPLVEQLCQAENVTKDQRDQLDARVLIIDEINRGNISRIFGELITLIEPSKRAGADEVLSVTLPYSKETFSVPNNVYIIGTMNTADRSLAGLDLALRRRFSFTEMPPQPELLDEVEVEGVNVGQMLRVMNQRITVLLGRDHTIGHAYFMPLQKEGSTPAKLAELADIFRQKILPLLQEYFFEDWERIRWVLNDHTKPDSVAFIIEDKSLDVSALFQGVADKLRQSPQWVLNDKAFDQTDAYRGIAANLGKGEA